MTANNDNENMDCCKKPLQSQKASGEKRGILSGFFYGLMPHIGCICFIAFSVLGATAAAAVFKPLLLSPYFFYILIWLSLVFATISAFFYFKRQGFISFSKNKRGLAMGILLSGIKSRRNYLLTLYGTTVGINLLLFMAIFPIAANLDAGVPLGASVSAAFGRGETLALPEGASLATLRVDIPCPGHASLIIGELRSVVGVEAVQFRFQFPNHLFDVAYNPARTSKEEIVSLDVFNTYKATVINE